MYRKKPMSHQAAYLQVTYVLERCLNGHHPAVKRDIHIAASIVSIIWRHDQVGIFQLKCKHIKVYINKRMKNLSTSERKTHLRAISIILDTISKKHWLADIKEMRQE